MASVLETKLRQIFKDAKLRPFKVSYYCEQWDPDFGSKMHDLLVIYKQLSIQFDEEGYFLPFERSPVQAGDSGNDELPKNPHVAQQGVQPA